jgi:hypothetical protein
MLVFRTGMVVIDAVEYGCLMDLLADRSPDWVQLSNRMTFMNF